MGQPALIVICGAPATGKTTLARRLAEVLRLPLLEKDVIKESLAEVLVPPDRAASRQIGAASTTLLYDLAFGMLQRGTSVMIECNFDRQFAEADLCRMKQVSRPLIVQCEADRDTIVWRYRKRHATGSRHAAHFDLDALPDLLAGLDVGAYNLNDLGYPGVRVRTNDGYQPALHGISAAIRRHCDAEM